MIRVVIANDKPLLREGLRRILEVHEDIDVVAEVGDGQGAINISRKMPFDLLLMNLNMPGTSCLQTCSVIRREYPAISILILAFETSDQRIDQLLKLGVAGYLSKDIDPQHLIDAIRKIHRGEFILSPEVMERHREQHTKTELRINNFGLSSRELEILNYVVKGASNKDIGLALFISEKTVKNHLSNIFKKLEVSDRTQAALKAVRTKMVTLE
ncbi:response regulator transcription factor [Dehalobacter sp. DCM]|uniref:response regulator transcription factor n=1 Tax=Dehalobacter sp. DCM TaxID=2907827 RepID=UPI0030816D80|nr:response regulator transcription factor [Dehalobacter sp. DCM]